MDKVKNSENIVLSLKQQTLDRLKPCLSLIIEDTADYLFSLSTSARLDPVNQNHCYDAFVMLQAETKQVVAQICAAVDNAFDSVQVQGQHEAEIDKTSSPDDIELALLDLEVFEETLAIEKIVRASTERFWMDLESLMFRLGSILEIPAEEIKLPVSPYLLCSAYRQALRHIEFPRNFLVDADSAFARKLLPELADIYQCLNSYLSDMGLLPNIEDELNRTGSQILINLGNQPDETRDQRLSPSNLEVDLDVPITTGPVDTQRLIHETDWINKLSVDIAASNANTRPFVRDEANEIPTRSDQLKAAGGKHTFVPAKIEPPSRDEASRNRLLSSSEHLLERRPPPSLEMESECLRIARALAQTRSEENLIRLGYEQLSTLIGFEPQPATAERLREAHKISSQLFDYLLQRLAPTREQTSAFANLETCFLELALVDPNFLIDGDHPGRLLVDRLTDFATLVPRGDGKHLDSLTLVIRELTRKFDGASGTLTAASNTLSDLSLRLIKQQRQNKDRLITRENARDKIDNARLLLLKTLNTAFANKSATQGLIDGITTVFVDRWVVALLKGVPLSKIEAEIKILRDTADSTLDQGSTATRLQGLAHQVELPTELTKKTKEALETLFAPGSDSGHIPDNWGLEIDLTPQQLDTLLVKKPRLKRAAKAIQKLPVDTWFRYETQQNYRYLQIVWANRHGTRFVLTDERGLKRRDLSIIQLALEFDRSLRRLSTVERLSLVEQTLFSKLSAIKNDVSQRFSHVSEDSASQLTHELERISRRTKRTGESVFAMGFTLAEDKSIQSLEQALADTKASVGAVCRLPKSRVCIMSSLEPEIMRKLVRTTHGAKENYEFVVKQLSLEEAPNGNSLAAALGPNAQIPKQPIDESASTNSRPFIIEQAMNKAIDQMAPHAQAIRLRTIIRVPVAKPENIETAFRLEPPPHDRGKMDHQTTSQQRSLRIASNLTELRELCKLLRDCERHQRARPHLVIRLNADTCLHAGAQDRILSLISEYAIGTSQLSFLISDSLQLRDSTTCHKLTRALRSIGCHIILDEYNPERMGRKSPEQLNATEIVIDTVFWERAAQEEPWKTLLPQLITDTHHILGQAVSVRDPAITDNIEHTGIDYIERDSDVLLSTSELLRSLGAELL